MTDLATLLASAPAFESGSVFATMNETPQGVFDPGFDMLAPSVLQADQVVGEAYVSQLMLARRLARGIDERIARKAGASLPTLLWDLLNGIDFKWERRFAGTYQQHLQAVMARGSHWKLQTEEKRKLSIPPPFEIPDGLDKIMGRVSYSGGDHAGFEDFFLSETLSGVVRDDIKEVVFQTEIGGRKSQQDYVLNFQGVLPSRLAVKISVVADGHWDDGDQASMMAPWFFLKRILELLLIDPNTARSPAIVQAIRYAEAEVLGAVANGGTTFVALVQIGEEKFVANVGDSRGYFLPAEGGYSKITIDHSGIMGPQHYYLLRALGEKSEKETKDSIIIAEPDIFIPTHSLAGGALLLFSDGVSENMVAWAIENNRDGSLQGLVASMIEGMSAHGTADRDNMAATAIAF